MALAVEPRLLQHFGEELASQTFWTSVYSRAPEEYREAIRELASATQFSISFQWKVTLDSADEDQTVIRLCSDISDSGAVLAGKGPVRIGETGIMGPGNPAVLGAIPARDRSPLAMDRQPTRSPAVSHLTDQERIRHRGAGPRVGTT